MYIQLQEPQRKWLTRLVNHKNRGYWASDVDLSLINDVLSQNEYGTNDKLKLNEIVEYYTHHIPWKGTFDSSI